ncbi:hypothetical protein [Agrobacterium tumefaciens]|uniref:hypothetical protein n=1 Tax=Agrobacterium tumefaciens TaxID=358 RepID=UPI003B9DFD45
MDGWLKALVATACVVIIAGGGYYGWNEYRIAKVRAAIAERAKVDRLTKDYCNDIARRTIPEKVGQPVKTNAFIDDLKACDDRSRLDAFERHQLDMIGVF